MLNLAHELTALYGAKYNPRHIDEGNLSTLVDSIKTLGLVKPLIARGNLLVAGHQRSEALKKLGITKAAVYVLPMDTTVYDEVRFNQLHNGTDMDSGDEDCFISGLSDKSGFCIVSAAQITGNLRARMAYVRREISEMILKYGPWGGCVATQSGEVIHCAQYALASLSVKSPLTVYVIPDDCKAKYKKYLERSYGVFSYEHLEKHTYVQTYAQMMRLRTGRRKENHSQLYEKLVIPWLVSQPNAKSLRGIDFGSGQGDYAAAMRKRGYDLHDIEFFRRVGAGNALAITQIQCMISVMCKSLTTRGQYDYVICDSVLNSVDSPEAERAVITFIRGLCKPGGALFFSGRRLEFEKEALRYSQSGSRKSKIVFLDENNFTAKYRKGHWFYQKFHSAADVKALASENGLTIITNRNGGSSFQVHATPPQAPNSDELAKAIRYEFELPLPAGKRLGRSGDVLKAFGLE